MPEPKAPKICSSILSKNGKSIQVPRLVNRGGAGLYGKLTDLQRAGIISRSVSPDKPKHTVPVAKYKIDPVLVDAGLIIPIDSVQYDPDNARLHPEPNKEAIKQSLRTYGQKKPIVVQASTRHIIAGNGTWMCAKELGWIEIAAVISDMSDAEAAGYGLADNKTAELAKWDFDTDVLKRLERKISSAGLPMSGWSESELAVIRMSEWIPPKVTDEEFGDEQAKIIIKCNGKEYARIDECMNEVYNRRITDNPRVGELTDAQYLVIICSEWMELMKEKRENART